jgi:ABC-type Fe3+ transport system permease subunit
MNKSPTVYSRISTAASSRQGTNKVSWSTHSRKILFLAFLVVVPIIAFTVTIISIVFVNSIDLNDCPDRDLCPYTNTTPGPANSSDYYVDFSVGRLAFVSSLSSTISFALVAAMMSLYGYVVAKQIMHASKEPGSQANLPTPYGASTLIRLLNAETILLGEMLLSGCRKVLTRKRVQRKPSKQPQLLRMCMSVLLLSLTAR